VVVVVSIGGKGGRSAIDPATACLLRDPHNLKEGELISVLDRHQGEEGMVVWDDISEASPAVLFESLYTLLGKRRGEKDKGSVKQGKNIKKGKGRQMTEVALKFGVDLSFDDEDEDEEEGQEDVAE